METVHEHFVKSFSDNGINIGPQIDVVIMAHEERTGTKIDDDQDFGKLSIEEQNQVNATIANAIAEFRNALNNAS